MCNKYYDQQNNKLCVFCGKETKVDSIFGRKYCPNAHVLVSPDGTEYVKQPQSIGNVVGRIVKRESNANGLVEGKLIK